MKLLTLGVALGVGSAYACLLDSEIEADRIHKRSGVRPESAPLRRRAPAAGSFPIGSGDRFDGGSVAPVGLGVEDREIESILNVEEISSALEGLRTAFPDDVELFEPPFETYEGRPLPGAVVGGDDPRVFIMSGIHARERGGPDNVIYFLADLLAARRDGVGLSYGARNYTSDDVETALSAGLVVMPLTNPDGVQYDQTSNTCWRKNRNPESSSGGGGNRRDVGVDLNRNYDFVWDFENVFSPQAEPPASNDPSSETFCGTSAASEPETKAVVWALDRYKGLTWFMDLHSVLGELLYLWGDDDAASEDPAQNFANAEYDGDRGVLGDRLYREYLSASDAETETRGVEAMVAAMRDAGRVRYEANPASSLYPTSGASNDYAMGRFYGKVACDSSRMFGLTLEFGEQSSADPRCPFYPSAAEFHDNVRQVGAGFMEMMLQAAGPAGERVYPECGV